MQKVKDIMTDIRNPPQNEKTLNTTTSSALQKYAKKASRDLTTDFRISKRNGEAVKSKQSSRSQREFIVQTDRIKYS